MSDDWKMQVSIKTPLGTLANLRGDSQEELMLRLTELEQLVPTILSVERLMTAANNVTTALPPAPVAQQWDAQDAQSQRHLQPMPQQAPWPQQQSPQQFQPQGQQWGPPPPPAPPQPQHQQQVPQGQAPVCEHGLPAKYVQGGVSRSSGRPYKAFWACSLTKEHQCKFRQDG